MHRRFLVCRLLPPRNSFGAHSSTRTLAPDARALRAAHNAAFPPPATNTSIPDASTGMTIPKIPELVPSRRLCSPENETVYIAFKTRPNKRAWCCRPTEPDGRQILCTARERPPTYSGCGRPRSITHFNFALSAAATPKLADEEADPELKINRIEIDRIDTTELRT